MSQQYIGLDQMRLDQINYSVLSLDQISLWQFQIRASSILDWMIQQQCGLCELVVDQIRLVCGSFRLVQLVVDQISSQEFRLDELVVDQIRLDQLISQPQFSLDQSVVVQISHSPPPHPPPSPPPPPPPRTAPPIITG